MSLQYYEISTEVSANKRRFSVNGSYISIILSISVSYLDLHDNELLSNKITL